MGTIRVQGNGIYLPFDSAEVKFFDGGHGVSGDFGEFMIDTLPRYNDIRFSHGGIQPAKPTLCMSLSDYREYAASGISLETTGDSVSIPIVGQDLVFLREL